MKKLLRRIIILFLGMLIIGLIGGGVFYLRWKGQVRQLGRQRFPAGIVIHHTLTAPVVNGRKVDIAFIDAMHKRKGFGITDDDGTVYHIGYHYLIQQDGTIQRGRPEHLRGAHARGHNNTLGIVLVGNFNSWQNFGQLGPNSPTSQQLAAAERLTRSLMVKYSLTPDDVYLHRELVITHCPGNNFPRTAFIRALAGTAVLSK